MSDAWSPSMAVVVYRALEHVANTSYVMSDTYKIVRVNDAWTKFALANDGAGILARWGRGSDVLDAISGTLREFYRALFGRAITTGQPVEQDYECSSVEVQRFYRMRVVPIDAAFLMVTHSLRVEHVHGGTVCPPDDASYLHDGVIRMCANCRRVHHVDGRERWDWVPAYLTSPRMDISHGLCPACAPFFAFA